MNIEQGFVLTRQTKENGTSTDIHLWVKSDSAVHQLVIGGEQSILFIEQAHIEEATRQFQAQQIQCNVKPLKLKDFQQNSVAACYFPSVKVRQTANAATRCLCNSSLRIRHQTY